MSEILFTSSATAKEGREGHVRSSDGNIDFETAMPGTPKAKKVPEAVNPEQLFAAGYASCFDGALQRMARTDRVRFDSETTASVSLIKDESDDGFKLGVKLQVKGTGIDKETLEGLVKKAHEFCPYSKATRGNIEVTIEVEAD